MWRIPCVSRYVTNQTSKNRIVNYNFDIYSQNNDRLDRFLLGDNFIAIVNYGKECFVVILYGLLDTEIQMQPTFVLIPHHEN